MGNEDTRQGQSLRRRGEARRDELERALARLDADGSPGTRNDIEAALNSLATLFTGDMDHIGLMVAQQLATWLETSKYLGAKETREAAAVATPPVEKGDKIAPRPGP